MICAYLPSCTCPGGRSANAATWLCSASRWFNDDDTRLDALAKSAQKDADKIAAAKAKADEGFVTVGKKKKK